MSITANRSGELKRLIRRRVLGGLFEAVRYASLQLQDRLGDPFPPASDEGEYPARRTGQGQANTVHEVNRKELAAGFGYVHEKSTRAVRPPHTVPGAGHLTYLALFQNRKGPDDLFMEELDGIRRAFIRGAK